MEEHQHHLAPDHTHKLAETPLSTPEGSAKLPEISKLFSDTWDVLTKRIRPLVEVFIVSAGSLALLSLAFVYIVIGGFVGFLGAANINWESLTDGGMAFPQGPSTLTLISGVTSGVVISASLVAFILLLIYISLWIGASMSTAAADTEHDKSGFGYFLHTRTQVLPVLWTTVLRFMLILGGLVAFIIPGIIFSIKTNFAPLATILDGKRGLDALEYSKSLVQGRFGAVFGRLILLSHDE